eukprot:9468564-Pyramimonas_sp.AAC.1
MRPPPPSTAIAPCVSPTHYTAPWPHRELHRRSLAPPACVRHHPVQPLLRSFHPHSTPFRGP